jgi:hypothetical protein
MWSVPWQLAPKPGDATWDRELAELLVSTVEDELIFNAGGHTFFEALIAHGDRLSGDHKARVLEAAHQVVRSIIPGSDIAPLQFMAVHWISCALGPAEALDIFKGWAEEAFAHAMPDLMACALMGLRSYGELKACESQGDGGTPSTSLLLDQLDPPLQVELQMPFADFLAALQAIPPLVDTDYLMPSLLGSLPAGQPDRDRKLQEVCSSVIDELESLPPKRRDLTLSALAQAVIATRLQGEPVWTDARLSVFIKVLGNKSLCAEPGITGFIEATGKNFGYLPAPARDQLCDLLMRQGELLARNHEIVGTIVASFPFATAKAVFERWHEAFTHAASPSRNTELAGEIAQALTHLFEAHAAQRAVYSALTVHIVDDASAPAVTPPKTVTNANQPNLLLVRTLSHSQATIEQAIETKDEVAIRAVPWELFDICVRNDWLEELARFLISGIRNRALMARAGSHAWIDALSRFRSWLPRMTATRQQEMKTLIWTVAMACAEASKIDDAARYKAIQLLMQLDAQQLLKRLPVWSQGAAQPRSPHLKDSMLMGYMHLAAHQGLPPSRVHIAAHASGSSLSLFIPWQLTHNVPVPTTELNKRRAELTSEAFRRRFEPQWLLDPRNLPEDPQERDSYIRRAFKKVVKILVPLTDDDRAQLINALPDSIMRTRVDPTEPVWNATRFDLFMSVFDEAALCSQPGAAAFLVALHNHWPALAPDQRARVLKTLQSHLPNYKNETFRRGAINLLKLTAPTRAAQPS